MGERMGERAVPRRARARDAAALAKLFAGTPREVLARVVPGDPLGVRAVVARRFGAHALLLDADRALLRALARVALDARLAPVGDEAALARWIEARVDLALDELTDELRRDPLEATAGAPRQLARPLGFESEHAAAVCAAFHALDVDERRALLAIAVDAEPRALADPLTVRAARRALDACLSALDALAPRARVASRPNSPEVTP